MKEARKAKARRRTTAAPDYGVIDPDTFWDQVLPYPAAPDGPSTFDTRVEKAWGFMRNVFFKPEEHAAAAEAIVRLMTEPYKDEGNHNE